MSKSPSVLQRQALLYLTYRREAKEGCNNKAKTAKEAKSACKFVANGENAEVR